MAHLDPLLEEFFIALVTMTILAAIVAVLYRWVTGHSPWPYVIIAEVGAFGWGTAMLARVTSRPALDAGLGCTCGGAGRRRRDVVSHAVP